MSKYEAIFDALKNVRTFSENNNLTEVMQAVQHAEKMAMTEICNVDLKKHGTGYDALLNAMFPEIRDTKH